MARKSETTSEPVDPVAFTEADKTRARQWFKKSSDCRDRHDYDYAIESAITGLKYWPEAVEEGHMPLRSVALQRAQIGGKKPGMMGGLKYPMTGKDAKKCMLNAERLLSKDPHNATYAEGLLKNACKAGYLDTVKWVADVVMDALKRDKKPNVGRYKTYRETLIEAARLADGRDAGPLETWLLDKALQSLEYVIARNPSDEDLRNEVRDLAGRLTIARGKYDEADDFRDSLQDADEQRLLHDAGRLRQGEDSLQALIDAARKEWEASPEAPATITAYVEALLKDESKAREDQAVEILLQVSKSTDNYNLKLRADDIRLRRMAREARKLLARAKETKSSDDKQQYRLAAMELRQVTLDTFRERVSQYPTDLRLKYKLGTALFESGLYDEAIPMLQAATNDPRSRNRCQMLIGRAFMEKNNPTQAAEVLKDAIDSYELTNEFSKELLYWLARAYEADGKTEDAKVAYGKLLRQDYNFMDGDARKRLEGLK